MEWIVNVEGKKNQRVLIRFEPQAEEIYFVAQYKVLMSDFALPLNDKSRWVDFASESHPMDIDLETIQDLIGKVLDTMKDRLITYEDLSKSFAIIKTIAVDDGTKPDDEEVVK